MFSVGSEAVAAQAGHLRHVFSEARGVSAEAAAQFIFYAPSLEEQLQMLTFDEFAHIARHVRHSSPGPFGALSHLWRAISFFAGRVYGIGQWRSAST